MKVENLDSGTTTASEVQDWSTTVEASKRDSDSVVEDTNIDTFLNAPPSTLSELPPWTLTQGSPKYRGQCESTL